WRLGTRGIELPGGIFAEFKDFGKELLTDGIMGSEQHRPDIGAQGIFQDLPPVDLVANDMSYPLIASAQHLHQQVAQMVQAIIKM
ncbi:MAG: hypothetical protein GWN87_16500, partial [Desulfuromonadales bacterium]|nr:hypothetical protein [Desulfuromonadales bacterium]NIS41815.1 hypothetical protein [Desulfuromonadales bacterium]